MLYGCVLRDNSDLFGSVDGQTRSQEVAIAHAERVEIAAILVADTGVAGIAITALGACAAEEAVGGTWMRGIGGGVSICFPDVHFTAAGTKGTSTGVRIGVTANPSLYVSLYRQRLRQRLLFSCNRVVRDIPLHQ